MSEIDEDLERGVRMLLWVLLALLAGSLGVLLSGLTVMIYFWDTHRLVAAFGVTAFFLLACVLAGLMFRARLHEKPRLLDATRTELQRDVWRYGEIRESASFDADSQTERSAGRVRIAAG